MAFALPVALAGLFSSGAAAGATAAAAGTGLAAGGAAGSIAAASAASAAAAGAATTGAIASAGLELSAIGGLASAAGAYSQGQSSAKAAKYNAEVATSNAAQAKNNSAIASQAGAEQAAQQSLKTRAEVGSLKANQAAAGLDVNSGSALDVRSSAQQLGELDALTVRSNATKAAYGYDVQSENFTGEANLDKSEASSDETSSYINAGSTLLGSAGSAASNFAKYQLAGGFSG